MKLFKKMKKEEKYTTILNNRVVELMNRIGSKSDSIKLLEKQNISYLNRSINKRLDECRIEVESDRILLEKEMSKYKKTNKSLKISFIEDKVIEMIKKLFF